MSYHLLCIFLIGKKQHNQTKGELYINHQLMAKPVEAHLCAEVSGFVPIPSITLLPKLFVSLCSPGWLAFEPTVIEFAFKLPILLPQIPRC